MGAKKEVRVIKKYSNRRLYDTKDSQYVTQDNIKELVSRGEQFRVVTKTGEDITRSVLLHIILDEEIMGVPLFTEEALRSIIMMSGSSLRSSMAGFFEQMLPMLQQYHSSSAEGPLPGMADEVNERIRDQYAMLQGMMLGNTFMENVSRNMKFAEEVNKSIVENTAKIINPMKGGRKSSGKK